MNQVTYGKCGSMDRLKIAGALLIAVVLYAGPAVASRCELSKISIKSFSPQLVNSCRRSDCTILDGVAVVTNGCAEAVGIQFKIIAYDKSGKPVSTADLWPASTNNIPPGKYTFSVKHWLDYRPDMARFSLEAIAVNKWGR